MKSCHRACMIQNFNQMMSGMYTALWDNVKFSLFFGITDQIYKMHKLIFSVWSEKKIMNSKVKFEYIISKCSTYLSRDKKIFQPSMALYQWKWIELAIFLPFQSILVFLVTFYLILYEKVHQDKTKDYLLHLADSI